MNEQVVSMVTEEKGAVIAPKKVKHMSIGKKIAVCLGVAALSSCMALSVSATGEESTATTADLNTAMTTSFSTVTPLFLKSLCQKDFLFFSCLSSSSSAR